MHTFGSTENAPPLLDAVEVLETAITVTGELNAQKADTACNVSEIQGDMCDLKEETACNREAITATHAEQERRVVTVREAGQARPEELRSKLEAAPYELSAVNSPTLTFSYELMVEIFDWHMLMGGRWTTTLLVCKWWTMVAYDSPRLWSRISVTDHPHGPRYLRGSVICTDLDQLRLVLLRSRSCPLQVEISFLSLATPYRNAYSSSTSLMPGPQSFANRIKAIKLILDDQILGRCTELVLANDFLPFNYQNTTVLPLLSSIRTYSVGKGDDEIIFVQSLVDLSPALRHIHYDHSLSAENKGVGLWTKRIESYSWVSPSAPCYPLHESPSLRKLGIRRDPAVPLTLPALQVLKWSIGTYSALHRITAPHLHTLIIRHGLVSKQAAYGSASSISFPNLRVAIHTWVYHPRVVHMFHTPTLEHLSITCRSSAKSSTALLELFDGSTHMPTPKSLHLNCAFADDTLITMLGRLPWLEELQVAGTAMQDTFWKRMTPSCNPMWQLPLTKLLTDGRATRILAPSLLVPNLQVLLVHYPIGTQTWTARQASTCAVAREQAGCPLRTLACWSPEQKAEVLIGSLDSLLNRPKFVSLTAHWWYHYVLTSINDRWNDVW